MIEYQHDLNNLQIDLEILISKNQMKNNNDIHNNWRNRDQKETFRQKID